MDSVHEGFEISYNPRQNPCAPYFIRVLRMFARSTEHAQEIINAHLNRPAQHGPRIVAGEVKVVHGLSASQCRNRTEQASAQQREGGRFTKTLRLTNPVTGTAVLPVRVGGTK